MGQQTWERGHERAGGGGDGWAPNQEGLQDTRTLARSQHPAVDFTIAQVFYAKLKHIPSNASTSDNSKHLPHVPALGGSFIHASYASY